MGLRKQCLKKNNANLWRINQCELGSVRCAQHVVLQTEPVTSLLLQWKLEKRSDMLALRSSRLHCTQRRFDARISVLAAITFFGKGDNPTRQHVSWQDSCKLGGAN